MRPDVTVLRLASTGLSRSRNAALAAARGALLLLADDDVAHPAGAYYGIRPAFAADPGLDLFVGRSLDPGGRPRKRPLPPPPADPAERRPRLEPRDRGAAGAVRPRASASTRASASAPAPRRRLGEEYVFLADCLAAGLAGVHDPLPVSVHPRREFGLRLGGRAQARARALVFARVFGRAALPSALAFALKHARRFARPADLWAFLRG